MCGVVGGVVLRVVFALLFFCKQKTAYEMRISDWSSDVCSSDLPLRRHEEFPSGFKRPDARREHADEGVLDAIQPERRPDDICPTTEPLLPEREIGRASCRARVCQYV